ncbi:MAG TPA: (deoxy)nucleoside triphosphate pyrophosphohydrolase [Steroidobacteraceae bacterium]|nr:(deoxy)nucleoside triphosphate pyrophosphohydrolase [Steroidobacteraceae bacterium]
MSKPIGRAPAPLQVVAGALVDARGRVLITERPAGKALAGRWEFPGGKRALGETPRAALRRELAEELGIEVDRAAPLLAVTYRYPAATVAVHIDCWRVDSWHGEPVALDRQRLRWCTREELAGADILEADRPIVTALLLPRVFVRLTASETLVEQHASAPGGRERTAWLVPAPPADSGVTRRLEEHGDLVFIIDPHTPPAGGVGCLYSTARHFEPAASRQPPAGRIVHAAGEARAARAAGADFLVVPDGNLPRDELRAIADVGLPWYLDMATPVDGVEPAPTGRLQWRGDDPLARF